MALAPERFCLAATPKTLTGNVFAWSLDRDMGYLEVFLVLLSQYRDRASNSV
jgi:hypothetical protein